MLDLGPISLRIVILAPWWVSGRFQSYIKNSLNRNKTSVCCMVASFVLKLPFISKGAKRCAFCLFKHSSSFFFNILNIKRFNFSISYNCTPLFGYIQPHQAGSSYLPCGVERSVSNIHGCETIKSWCDYRGIINVRTETSKNINLYS